MAHSPQSFFRFASRHYPLLLELFYRQDGFNEADLRDLIIRHQADQDPQPATVMEQLQQLGFIEPLPEASAVFELTGIVRQLLAYLLREQRLTSAQVIQGYLNDLEELRQELDQAAQERHGNQAARALADVVQLLERVRQDSRANREAIINQALRLKTNKEKRSTRERFETINRLWTRYLEPLRDLIDVNKAMDASLDRLQGSLKAAGQAFVLDGALSREIGRCQARLLRLRRQMYDDFHESLREVEPLYTALKKESQLVRGASQALETLDRQGLAALQLPQLLALPEWRLEGQCSDAALEAYFYTLQDYQPTAAPQVALGSSAPAREPILTSELLERLEQSLPVADIWAWLLREYPQASTGELLRAYGHIFFSDLGRRSFGSQQLRYQLPTVTLIARPLSLEPAA